MGSLWAFTETTGYILRCPSCQNIVMMMTFPMEQIYLDGREAAYQRVPKKKM